MCPINWTFKVDKEIRTSQEKNERVKGSDFSQAGSLRVAESPKDETRE